MNKKSNSQEYLNILATNGITKLYHFTDRSNLQAIISNGGLYSWKDCEEKGISISKPGGGQLSRDLDCRNGLQHYVRTSFTRNHPMMYAAQKEGRITDPVVLEIDLDVVTWQDTHFADRNAASSNFRHGTSLSHLSNIHFSTVRQRNHFDLDDDERPFYQAEVMVKNFIPLQYITNIGNFGIAIPSSVTQATQSSSSMPQAVKEAYTAQITRNTPTAFIFLLDHSISMNRKTKLLGEEMTMSEAAARIVNKQINDLVLRCVKGDEVRHYYDIAVIGYGTEAYSAWQGNLRGRDFVSPEEIINNPYKKIITKEEKHTRKGIVVKEVEKVQWIEAQHNGRWTYLHKALDRARHLIDEWMERNHDKDCYPPTIINITDGKFNGASIKEVMDRAISLRAQHTNDGNVLMFNVHIIPDSDNSVVFPVDKSEVGNNSYAQDLYDMSSLLPLRYNDDISRMLNDNRNGRHVAMATNADMSTFIKIMDIGTPTNITQAI